MGPYLPFSSLSVSLGIAMAWGLISISVSYSWSQRTASARFVGACQGIHTSFQKNVCVLLEVAVFDAGRVRRFLNSLCRTPKARSRARRFSPPRTLMEQIATHQTQPDRQRPLTRLLRRLH